MKIPVWLPALLILCSVPIQAANPFRTAELSDAELSELRGRYVMPGRIINFGVTMSSVWENSAGQSVGAAVTFHMGSQARPSLQITDLSSQSGEQGASPLPGAGEVLGGAGLAEVRGISQSVRSAGDFNNALNNMEIVLSGGAELDAPAGASSSWNGSKSFANEAGRVLVDRHRGGLRMQLDAGSQGTALQQVGGGNLLQQANFSGDFNSVRNMTTLSVGLRELPLGQNFANCTLEQLRALRPVGF